MDFDKLIPELTKELKKELERMKPYFKNKLKDQVLKNVYSVYTPKEYERTYALLDSITVSEVKIVGNSLEFEIFFDSNKLTSYYSVISGSNTYNGKTLNIPNLLEEGHFQDGYTKTDYFHIYPARNFIRDCIIEIKKDLDKYLNSIVGMKVESSIIKVGGKNSY